MNFKRKTIVISILFILIILQITLLFMINNTKKINFINPKVLNVSQGISANGNIYNNGEISVLTAQNIFIEKILIKPNETVKKGDIIAKINIEKTKSLISNNQKGSSDEILSIINDLNSDINTENYIFDEKNENIVSNYDGKIKNININENNQVERNSNLYTIITKDDYYAQIEVEESLVSKLKVGMEAKISGISFPNSTINGSLMQISDKIQKTVDGTKIKNIIKCKVKLLDSKINVINGASITAKLITNRQNQAIIVPYCSILEDENNNEYVCVLENGKIKKQLVDTGDDTTDGVIITNGLYGNEYIVDTPDKKLINQSSFKAVFNNAYW